MRSRIEIFLENPTLGGFSIAVRDDWSFKIKRIHITTGEKEAYQKQFGDTILLERNFLEWWTKYKQAQSSDTSESPVK